MSELVDSFGEVVRDLSISVTDRCDPHCPYCAPADGVTSVGGPELLGDNELARLVSVAVRLGVRRVRLAGGEPLARRGVVDLVRRLAALRPRPELALTSGGVRLAHWAPALAGAGLDRLGVRLDTVRPPTFHRITGREGPAEVLDGLAAAHRSGLRPVRVHAALHRGINDDQSCELLAFCLDHGYALRFGEYLPLDATSRCREDMVTADEIVASLRRRYRITALASERAAEPVQHYLVGNGPSTVGIVASVTRPLRGSGERLCLTADGRLRACPFAMAEADLRDPLRDPLRDGASDAELADRMRRAVAAIGAGHGIDDPPFLQYGRAMAPIGS